MSTYKKYSPRDLEFLRENYTNYTNEVLASLLGTSENSISSKLYSMGLKRGKGINPYTPKEIDIIERNKNLTYKEIAKLLGGDRTETGVRKFVLKLKENKLKKPVKHLKNVKEISEEIVLEKIPKGAYNYGKRGAKMKNYLLISKTGQIRFSQGLINRMSISPGVFFDLFTNKEKNRFFIKFGSGDYKIQAHSRKRKITQKDNSEFISQSAMFKNILNETAFGNKDSSVKMEVKKYIQNLDCYELEHLPIKKRKPRTKSGDKEK